LRAKGHTMSVKPGGKASCLSRYMIPPQQSCLATYNHNGLNGLLKYLMYCRTHTAQLFIK